MNPCYRLIPKDPHRLLRGMMRQLAGADVWISLEGDLSATALASLGSVRFDETPVLQRGTWAPKLDFYVLPLNTDTLPTLVRNVCDAALLDARDGLIHVQIAVAGRMAFIGNDRLHPECVVAFPPVGEAGLDALVEDGALVSWHLEP